MTSTWYGATISVTWKSLFVYGCSGRNGSLARFLSFAPRINEAGSIIRSPRSGKFSSLYLRVELGAVLISNPRSWRSLLAWMKIGFCCNLPSVSCGSLSPSVDLPRLYCKVAWHFPPNSDLKTRPDVRINTRRIIEKDSSLSQKLEQGKIDRGYAYPRKVWNNYLTSSLK